VRRTVLADDFVYAISDAGIRVANVNDLAHPLATATFEPSATVPFRIYSGNPAALARPR
jgi:hypothetical protein